MDKDTRKLALEGQLEDQQAIVDLINRNKATTRNVTQIIPGGKHLLESETTIEELTSVLYTQLRRIKTFEEVTISMVEDPSNKKATPKKIHSFPKSGTKTFWEAEGRRELAAILAKLIQKEKPISLLVNKEGITLLVPTSTKDTEKPGGENWKPHLVFRAKR